MAKFINYGRIHNNVVTHTVQTPRKNWVELNPWTEVPGEWEILPDHVKPKWTKDTATGTWSEPTN
jgi:hypothetical protein